MALRVKKLAQKLAIKNTCLSASVSLSQCESVSNKIFLDNHALSLYDTYLTKLSKILVVRGKGADGTAERKIRERGKVGLFGQDEAKWRAPYGNNQ